MTQYQQIIGDADQLVESGKGLRFEIAPKEAEANAAPERLPAFVIRHQGGFFAYLNRCGHIAVPLDFMPGEFFTEDGDHLICATHGATYSPTTGACLGGPCFGVGLEALDITIHDNTLYLTDDRYTLVTELPD